MGRKRHLQAVRDPMAGAMGDAAISPTGGGLPPPVITTTSPLPAASAGTAYNQQMAATGTVTAWSLESGTLPAGLSLSSDGLISGTPTETGTFADVVIRATGPGGISEGTFSITVNTWFAGLVAAIEAVSGLTCTHAAFVDSGTTTQDSGGTLAENETPVYRIFDLKAGGYDYIEGAAGRGGVFMEAVVGTRAGVVLDRTHNDYLKTVKNADAGTPALLPAGDHTKIAVVVLPDNNVSSSTARFNPLIWGSSDMGSAGGAAPSMLLRDDVTNRIHAYDAAGTVLAVDSTAAPYDTPLVLSLRNKLNPDGEVVLGSDGTYARSAANASVASLAKLFRIGFGADYLSGTIGCVMAFDGYMDDETMDAVVSLCQTAFGLK